MKKWFLILLLLTLSAKENSLLDKVSRGESIPAKDFRKTVETMNHPMTLSNWSNNKRCKSIATEVKRKCVISR